MTGNIGSWALGRRTAIMASCWCRLHRAVELKAMVLQYTTIVVIITAATAMPCMVAVYRSFAVDRIYDLRRTAPTATLKSSSSAALKL